MKKQATKIFGITMLLPCLLAGCCTTGPLDASRQSFLDAILKTMATENMTLNATMSIFEDSNIIFSAESRMERDNKHAYSTMQASINGKTVDMENSWMDGSMIFRMGEEYNAYEASGMSGWMMKRMMNHAPKMTEKMINRFFKDVGDHFTEENGIVTISLQEADIPSYWNDKVTRMFDIMSTINGKENDCTQFTQYFGEDVFAKFPITSKGRLTQIVFIAKLENGLVTNGSFKMTFSGTDKTGAERTVIMNSTATLLEVGSTTLGRINIEGKTVTPIKKGFFSRCLSFFS